MLKNYFVYPFSIWRIGKAADSGGAPIKDETYIGDSLGFVEHIESAENDAYDKSAPRDIIRIFADAGIDVKHQDEIEYNGARYEVEGVKMAQFSRIGNAHLEIIAARLNT